MIRTKLQLKVESKELEEKKKKYELEQAEKELTKLQNTAPYVEPAIPEPEPEPLHAGAGIAGGTVYGDYRALEAV